MPANNNFIIGRHWFYYLLVNRLGNKNKMFDDKDSIFVGINGSCTAIKQEYQYKYWY